MADFKAYLYMGSDSVTRSQGRKRREKRRITGDEKEENDAGFRFTRQSKRLREKQTRRSHENKDTATKTKRRRSSFIRGRKIVSPLNICLSERLAAVQGLYKEIPVDLNPDERLLQLLDKSLLLMCENAKDQQYTIIPNFPEKAKEFVGYLRTSLNDCELAKRAKGQKQEGGKRAVNNIQNPKVQRLEEYAKKSRETTDRMLTEDKQWNEILKKYEKSENDSTSDLMPSCVSAEQREFLDSVQPREGMSQNLEKLKSESILMVDKIVTTASTVKALNDAAERHLQKGNQLTESLGPVSETPRHLIRVITKDSEERDT